MFWEGLNAIMKSQNKWESQKERPDRDKKIFQLETPWEAAELSQ